MAKGNGKSKRGERVSRPEAGRTKPARNWETMFGPPPDEPGSADGPRRAAENGAATNPIARGVELGYRVMDEYVRQGARVAGMRGPAKGAADGAGTALPQLTERMFQYASDFASVWLEAMGVMMRNGGGPGASAPATSAPASAPPPGAAPPEPAAHRPAPRNGTSHRNGTISLAVDVASRRPVQATVDLRSGSIDGPVVVQGLRSRDPGAPQLKGVALEAAPNGKQLTLRLKVANGHPAGEYVGAIVDQSTGVTRGTLTVTVGERAS